MLRTRTVLLFLAAAYLAISIGVAAQSLDRRITILEQQVTNQIQNVTQPTLQRLEKLEHQVQDRDLLIEGRLVALERSIANFGQLLLAVGTAVLIQIITAAIGGLRAARLRKGP